MTTSQAVLPTKADPCMRACDAEFAKGEVHVTGGISVMIGQYFYATRSVDWLRTRGFAVLEGAARFWTSRAVKVSRWEWV